MGRKGSGFLKGLDIFAIILVLVGGLNWGLFGLFSLDLVAKLGVLVMLAFIPTIIYILVGLATLYLIIRILAGKDIYGIR